jgi:FkbM family methyltransferase
MRDNIVKRFIKFAWLHPNSTQRILFGPMSGMFFRINAVTGLAPIYSGGERRHQRFFRQFLQKGMVVIDVGAGWGLHTLYASRLVGEEGKVIAIEPCPSAFEELRWHVEKNHCPNAISLKCAASDQDGQIILFSDSLASKFFLKSDTDLSHFNKEVAPAKKLDTIAGELSLRRVDLIKVDVEGAEERVIRGSEKVISQFRPYLVIELHDEENDVSVATWLTQRGYALKRLDPVSPPIRRTDIGWPNRDGVWGYILAIP